MGIQSGDGTEARAADANDTSDSVLPTVEVPAQTSNGSGSGESDAEPAADEALQQSEDDLLREMEEIEGDKKPSAESVESAPQDPPSEQAEQETSDLLKELENDAGEPSDSNGTAEKPTTHQSPNASCVDSTTEPSLPATNASAESAATSPSTVQIPSNTESADDHSSAMEVDEQPEPTAEEAIEKDEAISSTSTDEAQASPVAEPIAPTAADHSTTAHQEAESASTSAPQQDAAETKDEAVTSSEDLPDASTNEADSSDAKVTESPIANNQVEAPPAAAANELNRTLEQQADNKAVTNLMMNNGSSTPNSNPVSAAATPNVFNSTPISKQFEISSENVSKIDEHSAAGLTSHNASSQEDIKTSDILNTFSGKLRVQF